MDVTVIVGVRPHYIKACGLQDILIDTDINLTFLDVHQHYDAYLRDIFLKRSQAKVQIQSTVTRPKGTPMDDFIRQISDVGNWLVSSKGKKSKAIIVFGDANPAFAGAIAANRLGVPIIHLEAGVRRITTEKEHWNSIATDHLSSLRYCYTPKNLNSLRAEGLGNETYLVGDVLAEWTKNQAIGCKSQFSGHDYCLVSIHRPQNCRQKSIKCLCNALSSLGKEIIWILHPRLEPYRRTIENIQRIKILPPQSHTEALGLLKDSSLIVTDSGGFVREGVLLERKVVVCHENGMWEDLVHSKAIIKADMNSLSLLQAFNSTKELKSGHSIFLLKGGLLTFKQTLISFLRSLRGEVDR